MDVSSIGPSGLDPFSAAVTPPPDDRSQAPAPAETPAAAPLDEDSGTHVDTTA